MNNALVLPDKPFSAIRIDFFNAAQRHELSFDLQERVINFVRRQLAIRLPLMLFLPVDWWGAHKGPRFRLKAPWAIRLQRMQSMAKTGFYFSRPK